MSGTFFEKVAIPLFQRYLDEDLSSESLILIQINAEFSDQEDEELPRPLHITNICKTSGAMRDLVSDVLDDIADFIKSRKISNLEKYEFSSVNVTGSEDVFIVIFTDVA